MGAGTIAACVVSVVTAIVSGGLTIWQSNKADARFKAAEKKATERAQLAGRRAVIKAFQTAARGSTALRIDKAVALDNKKWFEENKAANYYTVAKDTAEAVNEERGDYGYGEIKAKAS